MNIRPPFYGGKRKDLHKNLVTIQRYPIYTVHINLSNLK